MVEVNDHFDIKISDIFIFYGKKSFLQFTMQLTQLKKIVI